MGEVAEQNVERRDTHRRGRKTGFAGVNGKNKNFKYRKIGDGGSALAGDVDMLEACLPRAVGIRVDAAAIFLLHLITAQPYHQSYAPLPCSGCCGMTAGSGIESKATDRSGTARGEMVACFRRLSARVRDHIRCCSRE